MIVNAVNKAENIQSSKLSMEEINELYNKLYPFTQVTEEQKLQHVQNIKMNFNTPNLENDNVSVNNATDEKISATQICPKCGV